MNITFRPVESWPGEKTRGFRRLASPFKSPYSATLRLFSRELKYIFAKNVVVQIDLSEDQIRQDGLPKSNARIGGNPGVIVTFDSEAGSLQFPCDTYPTWPDNLRAIALALEALRKVDRYGVTQSQQQYTGWKKLHSDGVMTTYTRGGAADYLASLTGFSPLRILADRSLAKRAYKQAATASHPDHQEGDDVEFKRIGLAYATLKGAS